MQDRSDQALVQRVQNGDQQAFALLVAKYQRRIFRLISRFVADPASAEDIAQETFLRAYRAIGNFRGDSQFYTWLYRIAVNTAKRSALTCARSPVFPENSQNPEQDETFPRQEQLSSMDTPEAVMASRELVNAVNAAMEELPEELRSAIMLREIEGLSYEEISHMLGCPVGTVRSRIFRARESIARRLRPLLGTRTDERW
ncbi:MAG: RNA polymerase sigma factor RpoE [Betaproteobacteria bacterium]|nr:RNA polymerase sigma factor RpoE [Betaproteobacteria bacterium]MBU6510691.1 RNA polymerase sigma factor RpoE [Betaproteobacteria bacterium]MDE1956277.1 RNA polymerase sigma factor RpoE [Betaproteobacteria bacterium]MDE2152976.1 RNA polymerase sigma factor RpoE [Betaproteobacteria bacterium]MDE2480409.1 RNA polymerase sigma factor RpoE [Betaproteobacteria bacterium]